MIPGLIHNKSRSTSYLERFIPAMLWGRQYTTDHLTNDLIAGVIVAIMLVPQSMAYALLAGLPPQTGLYASIVPLVLYGLLGTSRSLAVGPVAMVSLLVAATIAPLAGEDISRAIPLALTLAFLSGAIQLLMGLLRVGFIVNFLSHPVLSAFTSAAAIIIGFSQLKHMLGFAVPRFDYFVEQLLFTIANLNQTNIMTLTIGLLAISTLFLFKRYLAGWLIHLGLTERWAIPLTKSGPLVVVVLGTLTIMLANLNLSANVSIVGEVPVGFSPLTFPLFDFDTIRALLPAAIAISMVGYMESVSVAKSLASKRREKIDPNQELIALGAANLGAAFTGGYPVTGGISRSVVNFSAGARTGMASIFTAGLVALTVLFLTPLFYYLPNAVLAAIILIAVINMVDFKTFQHVWRYNRADGIAWLITFFAVLGVGVETGILYGVGASLVLYVWRTSRPHIAVVGRLNGTETYRNILRHSVETWPELIAMRIDGSLYFANTKVLEDTVLALVAENKAVKDFILIGSAINFIDASAVETLEDLYHALKDAGVDFYLAAIKGPVLDQLKKSELVDLIGQERIFLSTHDAMKGLGYVTDAG